VAHYQSYWPWFFSLGVLTQNTNLFRDVVTVLGNSQLGFGNNSSSEYWSISRNERSIAISREPNQNGRQISASNQQGDEVFGPLLFQSDITHISSQSFAKSVYFQLQGTVNEE
jgi:hypothetical protein